MERNKEAQNIWEKKKPACNSSGMSLYSNYSVQMPKIVIPSLSYTSETEHRMQLTLFPPLPPPLPPPPPISEPLRRSVDDIIKDISYLENNEKQVIMERLAKVGIASESESELAKNALKCLNKVIKSEGIGNTPERILKITSEILEKNRCLESSSKLANYFNSTNITEDDIDNQLYSTSSHCSSDINKTEYLHKTVNASSSMEESFQRSNQRSVCGSYRGSKSETYAKLDNANVSPTNVAVKKKRTLNDTLDKEDERAFLYSNGEKNKGHSLLQNSNNSQIDITPILEYIEKQSKGLMDPNTPKHVDNVEKQHQDVTNRVRDHSQKGIAKPRSVTEERYLKWKHNRVNSRLKHSIS